MKVAVLYQSNSEDERAVHEFVEEYRRRTGRSLEMQDVNTRDGASTATLYDIVRYPAVLVMGPDGSLVQNWQGDSLPLMNEVMYYHNSMPA